MDIYLHMRQVSLIYVYLTLHEATELTVGAVFRVAAIIRVAAVFGALKITFSD